MANTIHPKGRQKWLEGSIAWLTDDFKAVIVDATYVYSEAHEFLDDLTGVVATSPNLASKTSTDGIADADPSVFSTVPAGPAGTQVWVYKDTGTPATSPLLVYWDADASSVLLSVTPDGGNIQAIWSDGALKMFRL
jgi:hypothetical protein